MQVPAGRQDQHRVMLVPMLNVLCIGDGFFQRGVRLASGVPLAGGAVKD